MPKKPTPKPKRGRGRPAKTSPTGLIGYEREKERARQIAAERSASGRDIGELPKVVKPRRKSAGRRSFRRFCEAYFPEVFTLGWSADHLRVIAKIERVVLRGELVAMAMPRGSGKTTLAETASLWAALYGHRRFVALIGSDQASAQEMLDSLKTELETNELLAEDFPEACYPIAKLEGISQRANGQTYNGKRTQIGWTNEEIILPTIPKAKSSGCIIKTSGITGRIRGMKHKRADGESARPDLAIIDDPQTDESARSASQCAQREKVVSGAVLGLAGPGKKIAAIMPCTVIQEGDLADRCLNRELHPEWQGERTKLLYGEPENPKRWEEYRKVYTENQATGDEQKAANEFYTKHRDELDAGFTAAWEERKNPEDVSAVQHAMHLRYRDENAFFAEYQNEPKRDDGAGVSFTASDIMDRGNGLERRTLPTDTDTMTAFVDVQGNSLWWGVVAWQSDALGGAVVDYGVWPKQPRDHVAVSTLPLTLQEHYAIPTTEAAIDRGLRDLIAHLMGQDYRREDGAPVPMAQIMVDANWHESTDVVYRLCRRSQYANLLMPSHGRGVRPSERPFAEYKRKPGDKLGEDWMIYARGARNQRHVIFDTNAWKTRVSERLAAPTGDRNALTLWGHGGPQHRMIAEHLTSEYCIATTGRGRTVGVWQLKPGVADNHLLDVIVGCAVAASIRGVGIQYRQSPRRPRRKYGKVGTT